MRALFLLLFATFAIDAAVAPREGWKQVADLMVNGDWECAPSIAIGAGGRPVSLTAGGSFTAAVQGGTTLRFTGDFSVAAEIESSVTANTSVISLVSRAASGPEFWRGLKRIDMGVSGNSVITYYWMGDVSNSTPRSFAFPGGRPTGPVRLELARVGSELVFYANGREAGRYTDPGLFSSGTLNWGIGAAPNTTTTLTSMIAAAPEANNDVALFDPFSQKAPRTGTGLRDLASARGFYFGAATDTNELLQGSLLPTIGREFNMLVAGNAMKFDTTHPAPGRYNFCRGDQLLRFAETNHMRMRGHVLLWHNQIPSWVTNGTYTQAEATALMKEHIETVVGHYKGRLGWWDVVNEAVSDAAPHALRSTFWLDKAGQNYIDDAFRFAHAADPDAKLFYNDYNGEGMGGKANAIYTMVQGMVARGVPIHGVGLQAHFQGSGAPTQQQMSDNIKRLGQLGLEVHVTELDVRLQSPTTPEKLEAQATVYRNVMAACRANANCTAVLTWGVTDAISWIDSFFPGYADGLMFDRQYQPKPAYTATVQEVTQMPLRPQILDGGAIIHAGLEGNVSPGSLADLYGARMATSTFTAPSGVLPTELGGVKVTVNGTAVPLYYVSPGMIILQIPYETKLGTAQVKVVTGGVPSLAVPMKVKEAAPFILTYGANRGIVQNSDYSLNSAENCARAGSFLIVYMMGSGPLDGAVATGAPVPLDRVYSQTLPTKARLGGKEAPVLFAGMTPDLWGLMQVNVTVPEGVSGDVELRVDVGEEQSNRPVVCVAP